MELLPLGPVMIIDTPGIDDEGELGKMRVEKSYQVLNKTDIALLVVDGNVGLTQCDKDLIEEIKKSCKKEELNEIIQDTKRNKKRTNMEMI